MVDRWRNRPLVKNFRATTFTKAFILNALAISFMAVFAIEMKLALEEQKLDESLRVFLTWVISFFTALVVFTLLHIFFGFGGGMLATGTE